MVFGKSPVHDEFLESFNHAVMPEGEKLWGGQW
jgi:hypothetical protein